MTKTADYVITIQNALDAAKGVTKAFAVEAAKHRDGVVMTNEGPVADALAELKDALRAVECADAELSGEDA